MSDSVPEAETVAHQGVGAPTGATPADAAYGTQAGPVSAAAPAPRESGPAGTPVGGRVPPEAEGLAEPGLPDAAPPGAAVPAPAAEEPDPDPAAPAPLAVPRTPTGNADADASLARLADADHLTTDGHVEVYEDVHRGLRDVLTALDARQGPPAPADRPAHAR